MARKFDGRGNQVGLLVNLEDLNLEDLATFGNINNHNGGSMSFTGDHAVKNLINDKKSKLLFNDHKNGLATKVDNFMNKGKASISGKHHFKNVDNDGG